MSQILNREAVTSKFTTPPKRVVSLVPSITESLFSLGLGESLAGVTDYCIHPSPQVDTLPHVGGPKNPDVRQIIELKPELICANQEENTPSTIQELDNAGIPVWLSFPQTVQQTMDILWTIVGIYHSRPAAVRLETLQRAVDWAAASASEITPWTYFCPIWQAPVDEAKSEIPCWWMTFNQRTYMTDLLSLFGGSNIFATRERRYPLEADLGLAPEEAAGDRDTRYPRITPAEVDAGAPDVILLPDEPYPYRPGDVQSFARLFPSVPAALNERILPIDGSLLTWHGTRLGKALNDLPGLLRII